MPPIHNRKIIFPDAILKAQEEIRQKLQIRLDQKGHGTFRSSHEIAGIITEEYHEMLDALQANDHSALKQELLDIAVSCLYSIACINSKTLDW